MGNCIVCKDVDNLKKPHRQHSKHIEEMLWDKISDFSFDSPPFFYLHQIQDTFTDLYGNFLRLPRLSTLILELKRFLFLHAKVWKQ